METDINKLIKNIFPYQNDEFITLLTEEGDYRPMINFWFLFKNDIDTKIILDNINPMLLNDKYLFIINKNNA